MIAQLHGRVLEVGPEGVVVEVGGLGVLAAVPAALRAGLRVGENVHLYTHLIVRPEALALFGFETEAERALFGLLLGVGGVGPKLALAILSSLAPEAVRRAVFHEQADIFARVPGVGKKTAQKILFHLQDKLTAEPGLERVAQFADRDGDVLAALTALGYSVVEAQAALQNLPRDAAEDVETRLRLALAYLGS
jgi:Holliday junction DNA helicase RuvA